MSQSLPTGTSDQITVIDFLRHSIAENLHDNHRLNPLSEAGVSLAEGRRALLGNPQYDLICTSELLRTKQTAKLIASPNGEGVVIAVVPNLFYKEDDRRAVLLEAAFAELHHSPLRCYYEMPGVQEALESLAESAIKTILGEIRQRRSTHSLVIGHDVCLPALLHVLTGADQPYMGMVLGECQGCRVTIKNGQVANVELIK